MKRKEPTLLLIAVTALFAGSLSSMALGKNTPVTAGPQFGIDDNNTANIVPTSDAAKGVPTPVSSVTYADTTLNGQCTWINTGLAAFKANNSSGATWNFSWAGVAAEQKVEQGITINDYYSWVVSEPAPISAGGYSFGVDKPLKNSNNNVNDVGGAVFNITYDPTKAGAGAPTTNLHWIQGLTAHYDTYAAGEYQTRLDNPFAKGLTPYYDSGGAAGPVKGGGGSMYFLDTPWKIESEAAEQLVVADVQFQVVLAADNYVAATKTHNVTLYGGEWWGYHYEATDAAPVAAINEALDGDSIETAAVPLPRSAGVGFGMLGLFGSVAVLQKKLSRKPRMAQM